MYTSMPVIFIAVGLRARPGRGAHAASSSHAVILLEVLVAVLLHQFGDRAVRRAELDDAGIQRRYHLTAEIFDLPGSKLNVVDLSAPMVNARAHTGKLRLRCILAVIDHQRQVDGAVGKVARDMPAVLATMRGDLPEAEHFLVELSGGFEISHLQRDVDDFAGHETSPFLIMRSYHGLADRAGLENFRMNGHSIYAESHHPRCPGLSVLGAICSRFVASVEPAR